MGTPHSAIHNVKRKCRHGGCVELPERGKSYCHYHGRYHETHKDVVESSFIAPIPLSRLMAGHA